MCDSAALLLQLTALQHEPSLFSLSGFCSGYLRAFHGLPGIINTLKKQVKSSPEVAAKRVFTCVPFRVEDRNDPLFQKMRRYIKAFSKEDDKDAKTDTTEDFIPEPAQLRLKTTEFSNRKSLTGWQMIRHSTLGLEFGQQEPVEKQDIKYV